MIVTVGCMKGGVGKSTTAMMLARLLAEEDMTTLIEADDQGSLHSEQREAQRRGLSWPDRLTVVPWGGADPLPPTLGGQGRGHVVIDTPPRDRAIFQAALRLSDHAVVVIGVGDMEIIQLGDSVALVEEVEKDHQLTWGVLLNNVKLGTKEARERPGQVDEDGFPRLATIVTHRQGYSRLSDRLGKRVPGAYRDVLAELRGEF